MIDISFVIICWNSDRYVKKCIDSLIESTRRLSKEIIIIDNGSTDSTVSLIQSYPANEITFLPQRKNLGVTKARNIGLTRAQGKYICILDVDTIVNEHALYEMYDFMNNNASCGICACKLVDELGNPQDSCRKYPRFRFKLYNVLEKFSEYSLLKPLGKRIKNVNEQQFYRTLMQQASPFEVEYVIGACQMIRKTALDEVGLLDENIFYGPEDADLCIRMKQYQYKVFYLPGISIFHKYNRMTQKKLFSVMSFVHIKSLMYFFWKHKRF